MIPRHLLILTLGFALLGLPGRGDAAFVRDLTRVYGARDNQLIGYGLVVGLANDGDKDPAYAKQTLANLLQRFGLTLPASSLSAKNVAVVMVTADIPAFVKPGARIDVTVSAIGDAKSLNGGVLLQTMMFGADDNIYAAAQGPVAVGGFLGGSGGAGGATVQKNHPTVAQIIGGALVEREIPSTIVNEGVVELLLMEPDFTTAAKMAARINEHYPGSSHALDSTSVRVAIPDDLRSSPIDFIALVGNLEVTPDVPARVIINERTGTIVANARIRIAACAVSHGNITITIANTQMASQPAPFANQGDTVIVDNTQTEVTEEIADLVPLREMTTVDEVASALNALGVTPRDIMAIFQAMKQAGALQAELLIR